MQHYPMYRAEDPTMIQQFLEHSPYCFLITQTKTGEPHSGIYNPLVCGKDLYLHLHRADEQLEQLRALPSANLVFSDYLGFVPSYAKDSEDASFATMFYRFVELRCRVRLVEDVEESLSLLETMMQRYQPEGKYLSLPENPNRYQASLRMIQLVHFTQEDMRCKWKLGQNRSPEERLRALSYLRF